MLGGMSSPWFDHRRRVAFSGSTSDPAHTILTITETSPASGIALVTTAGNHGLSGGENVTITGNTTYGGTFPAVTVESPTTFSLGNETHIGDSTGGTWSIA